MATTKVQVAVVGAGPGGYTAAFRAADLGLSVALIDEGSRLGGVCLNVGCIPSKTLLHMAEVLQEATHLGKQGINFSKPKIDLKKVIAHKDAIVGQLTGGLSYLAKKRSVTVIAGRAHFTDPHHLTCSDGSVVEFESCIIATGSRPATLPQFSDHPNIIDSTGALSPTTVPKNLLIIGGGIIGLEMACVYSAFGATVTIAEFLPELLPPVDREVVRPLLQSLEQMGITIHTSTAAQSYRKQGDALAVTLEKKNKAGKKETTSARFDAILVAIGRTPNTDLALDKAGLTTDDQRGFHCLK